MESRLQHKGNTPEDQRLLPVISIHIERLLYSRDTKSHKVQRRTDRKVSRWWVSVVWNSITKVRETKGCWCGGWVFRGVGGGIWQRRLIYLPSSACLEERTSFANLLNETVSVSCGCSLWFSWWAWNGRYQRLFAKIESGKLVKKWEVAGPHGCFGTFGRESRGQ